MPRVLSGTLAGIVASAKRDIDHTLDLIFPDEAFYFASSPFASLNSHTYTNKLERGIGEIRQTLEGPANNVSISVTNKDRTLGIHVAEHWQKWRQATAIVGRVYHEVNALGSRTGTSAWRAMYRGGVQQPNADDLVVTFDVVPDTVSPGQIVCNRSLGANCPFVFKQAWTCGYAGAATSCDHFLRSVTGCEGLSNDHHFGGTEHRYKPDQNIPGTSGNPGGGTGGCPRLDQYMTVRGRDGERIEKQVYFLTEDDWLWDSIEQAFCKVRVARIIRDVPIWVLMAANGAVGFSSRSHRVMPNEDHPTGLPVEMFGVNDEMLTEIEYDGQPSYTVVSQDTGERGDVMFIEMEIGHHYSYGDGPRTGKRIVAHNNKGNPLEPLE